MTPTNPWEYGAGQRRRCRATIATLPGPRPLSFSPGVPLLHRSPRPLVPVCLGGLLGIGCGGGGGTRLPSVVMGRFHQWFESWPPWTLCARNVGWRNPCKCIVRFATKEWNFFASCLLLPAPLFCFHEHHTIERGRHRARRLSGGCWWWWPRHLGRGGRRARGLLAQPCLTVVLVVVDWVYVEMDGKRWWDGC